MKNNTTDKNAGFLYKVNLYKVNSVTTLNYLTFDSYLF